MFPIVLSLIVLLIAIIPAMVYLQNIPLFSISTHDPERLKAARQISVSVLIPARNESHGIAAALDSILATTHPVVEVIVLDDHSDDGTGGIVAEYSKRDFRVRLAQSKPLASNWNGKQHACWQLANLASFDRLLFLDADVRLSPDAITRTLAQQDACQAPLISGFPNQETGTWMEKLLIPLMHFVLLGYLPIKQMRQSTSPGFAAGCGQFFLADRTIYMQVGGHSTIANSRHDGIKLPRSFRSKGYATDIFDAGDIAHCRMYRSATQVINGLLKNATEGIANVRLIIPFSLLLVFGAVLPLPMLFIAVCLRWSIAPISILFIAACIAHWIRIDQSKRYGQSLAGALFHPIGVGLFVALQWIALIRSALGLRTKWRGR